MTAFPVGVELEINGTWTDVTERARREPPTIHRGRPDENAQVAPTSATVVFDNSDGYLTPRNPESPWYPYIRRGLPCRLSVETGDPYLLLSGIEGGRAATPDNAALDITGDLFMLVELQAGIDLSAVTTRNQLVAKYNATGNQRSYYLALDGHGRPNLIWSTDGTSGGIPAVAISTYTVPLKTAGPVTFAAYLDVNVAGTSHTVTFWGIEGTRDELLTQLTADETAVRLGDPYTASGTTSIHSGTAPLEIGDISNTTEDPYPGAVRRVQVRSGTFSGSIVANPDFTIQTVGATTFTDSATRVWTLAGDARITDRQPRFTGNTSGITLQWPKARRRDDADTGVATATFEVAGYLRQLQQGSLTGAKPFNSTLRRLVTSPSVADNVLAYWPLEDGRDATSGASAIPGRNPVRVSSAVTFESDDTLHASTPLPSISGSEVAKWAVRLPPVAGQTQNRLDWFVKIDTPHTSPAAFSTMVVLTSGRAASWSFGINDTNVSIAARDPDGTSLVSTTIPTDAAFIGVWSLWSLDLTKNGATVDWTLDIVPLGSDTAYGTSGNAAASFGNITALTNVLGSAPPDGVSFGHFIITTGLGLGWLAGADTAWARETAAHRFWRLCSEENIPAALVGDITIPEHFRGDPTQSVQMGPQLPLPFVDLLQECATADLGYLYEQRSTQGLAFRTGRSLLNQDAAVTLDAPSHGLSPPFEPVLDDQRLRNDVTCTRPGGSSARQVDQESIDDEGLYDVAVEVNTATEEQLDHQAGWRLHLGTWPELRLPTISTTLLKAGEPATSQWLDADLGDRVEATNLMVQYDRDTDLLVEGYDETLSVFNWEVAITGSPAVPWDVGVLDTSGTPDTGLARVDSDAAVLNNAADTDDTTLVVNTATGPLWTEAAAQFPMLIEVGGEQMRVTAITFFAVTVQTFTVVRSINGVVKSHLAGAEVHVANPLRVTL